jgi:hypothetical protein
MTNHTYFASGSNSPAEIRGFARIGHDLGVTADQVSENAVAELVKLAGSGVRVFLDSGAFGEVKFNAPHNCGRADACKDGSCVGAGTLPFPGSAPFTFVEVKHIDDQAWRRILALYLRLANALGAQLFLVAPDRVGSQSITLERLERYSGAVRQLRQLGANIIVPIQKGEASQADFAKAVSATLGFDDYIRGIPSNKAAATPAEVAAFVAEARPQRVHLLGLGPRRSTFAAFAAAVTAFGAELLCDSCLITGSVGKSNGRDNMASETKGGPRVYTRAQLVAHAIIAEGLASIDDPRELGIVLAFSAIADESQRWNVIEAQLEERRACRAAEAA